MAYLVKVIYKDKRVELVPLWSSAYEEELSLLKRDNELVGVELVSSNPDLSTCEYYYSRLERTVYKLPREFKENRRGVQDE